LSKLLSGHEGCVNSLDFNKTGNIIASGSDDLNICLWDWSNDKCLINFKSTHARNIFQVNFIFSILYLCPMSYNGINALFIIISID